MPQLGVLLGFAQASDSDLQTLAGNVLKGMTTQLIVRMPPVDNAKAYEVRVSSVPGQWLPGGLYGSTRDMIIHGLTPGTMYTVQVRAIGGLTGFSDWSDPVSHMSM